MSELRKIKRALISVSDKGGIADFAKRLSEFGVEIISTGGTANALRETGLTITDVSQITGFPEMMDGRVKTLHPKIHGALLGLRDDEAHLEAMRAHSIQPIDLVVVNLYPFEQTIAKTGVSIEEAVEQIDIGGPAMIRSASKNWRDVAVITDARLYERFLDELEENDGSISLEIRRTYAALAYTNTSHYDAIISDYLTEQLSDEEFAVIEKFHPLAEDEMFKAFKETENLFNDEAEEFNFSSNGNGNGSIEKIEEDDDDEDFPAEENLEMDKIGDLRYGENPHQQAALYETFFEDGGIAGAQQLHGKEMSFNNYVDADAAWNLICEFEQTACAIIKHTNPSGVGIGATNLEAYKRALATDPVSAFGGIVAFNSKIDAETAKAVSEIFTEVVLAPDFDADALEVFKSKKNLRVLKVNKVENAENLEYKQISGGMLVQNRDNLIVTAKDLKVVSKRQPTENEIQAMLFAWKVCKHVKSNAIVFANETNTIGVGAGQMNRIDSVRIAAMRAERFELPLKNSVLASDAFFPFRDNIDEAAKFGIAGVIQPGGSVKDAEVIEAVDEHNLAMVLTGVRHFKH